MNESVQPVFSATFAELDQGIRREDIVEKAIHGIIRVTGVMDNLEMIAEHVQDLDLPPQLESRLLTYCKKVLHSFEIGQIRGLGGHEIRSLVDNALGESGVLATGKRAQEANKMLCMWYADVERIRRLSRDLANRIFYRRKQKDRELVELAARDHPLVKSWEGMSKRSAVERLSLSRMNKLFNRQANHLEVLLQRATIQTYPSRLTLEPTSACNYRCTMCSQGHYTERPSYFEIDDTAVERALPILEFVENLATQVTGEPTLSLQFGKIANYATSHGVYIDMITNGSLLHKTNADLSKFSVVCVSFDGATKEVFEAQRVGASFENVVQNIRMARDKYPLVEFEFNVCVTRLNIAQLPDIVRIAAEIGIDRVLLNLLNSRDYPHLAPLVIGAKNIDELNNAINAAKKSAEGTSVRVFNYITDQTLKSEGAEDSLSIPTIITQLAKLKTDNTRTLVDSVEKLISSDIPASPNFLGMSSMMARHSSGRPLSQSDSLRLVDRETVGEKYEALLSIVRCEQGAKIQLPYCAAPWKGGIIFANGEYTPCCYLAGEASFGSISRTSFEHVWNSPGIKEIRRSMFDTQTLIPTCRDCNGRQRYTFTLELLRVAHRLGYAWEEIGFPCNFNPPSVVKAQIDALRTELFDPGHNYNLGARLKFGATGNARPYMSSGFSMPGLNGVWNDGFESILTFQLFSLDASGLLFEVSLLPFLHADLLPQQRVEITVNGSLIDIWCIKQAKKTTCSVKVPTSLVDSDNKLQFVFRFPDASSAHDLGVGKTKGARSVMFLEAALSAH